MCSKRLASLPVLVALVWGTGLAQTPAQTPSQNPMPVRRSLSPEQRASSEALRALINAPPCCRWTGSS
jgi:hypothetical protein